MSLGSQVRKYRLQLGWTLEDLESRSGVGRGTINALENRGSKKSTYASDLASAFGLTLEQLLDESRNWLDEIEKKKSNAESSYEYAGRVPKAILLPVAGIAQLGENGWYDEIEANGTEGYVEHHSRDADAYALRVRGDSMYPAIRNGWYVVAEPNGALAPGEYAAVALADGRKMVKELLFESENEITLQSVNGGQRISVARTDIVSIHPVAAVVSPSKHRE